MSASNPPPPWLWQLARRGLALALLGVAVLAAALALGAADPPRAGPLRWESRFESGDVAWTLYAPEGVRLAAGDGGLTATFDRAAPGQWAAALAETVAGDFTLEVAGAAGAENTAAAYGLIYGWQDAEHYCAAYVNGNGYARAFCQADEQVREWHAWQQWPHVLAGDSANRVRVDVRGQAATLRVNDEVLAQAEAPPPGRVGVIALSDAPGRVVLAWARLWAP